MSAFAETRAAASFALNAALEEVRRLETLQHEMEMLGSFWECGGEAGRGKRFLVAFGTGYRATKQYSLTMGT